MHLFLLTKLICLLHFDGTTFFECFQCTFFSFFDHIYNIHHYNFYHFYNYNVHNDFYINHHNPYNRRQQGYVVASVGGKPRTYI